MTLAGWLTSRRLRDLDWAEVSTALANYSGMSVAMALFCALMGYIAVSQYDLVGRHYTGHSLAVRRVLAISFIGYTFSLNLGGLIGGVGFRYRLYLNAGLPMTTITRIIGLSVLGNWSGYMLLAGLLFTFVHPQLPPNWNAGPTLLRGLGTLLLITSCAYIWLCWRHAGRSWEFRNFRLEVPSPAIAAAQFALSLISWCA
ncbi:MAG TPA: YbhN family protein, partial [Halioglobus sp.]